MKTEMTPQDIIKGIQNKNRELTRKNLELQELSEKVAQAKFLYRVAKSKKILELKGKHPATLLGDIIKGDEEIAELRLEFDIADGVYKACRESIQDIRIAIDSYRSLLTWLKAEMLNSN